MNYRSLLAGFVQYERYRDGGCGQPIENQVFFGVKVGSDMATTVLLLGRRAIVLDDVRDQLELQDVRLFGGTSLDDVRDIFAKESIDVVVMGAGLPLETRVEIVGHVFSVSKSTTVHMKDWNSGPQGMLSFVNGVLRGRAQ